MYSVSEALFPTGMGDAVGSIQGYGIMVKELLSVGTHSRVFTGSHYSNRVKQLPHIEASLSFLFL